VLKVKDRVWGLFGTAACRPIVPLPPPTMLPVGSIVGALYHKL